LRVHGALEQPFLHHLGFQAGDAGLLVEALLAARGAVTDESSAVEMMGLHPRIVTGSRRNLKVTFPEDMAIAESMLGRQ